MEDARDIQLMESTVSQSNEAQPLLELGGYTFSKIVVDQVTDADGNKHEVMFVTAHKDGKSTWNLSAISTCSIVAFTTMQSQLKLNGQPSHCLLRQT